MEIFESCFDVDLEGSGKLQIFFPEAGASGYNGKLGLPVTMGSWGFRLHF